ncbi:MAG: hypothetical protein NVSMB4_02670 [Acidimicrobiales bacterium]
MATPDTIPNLTGWYKADAITGLATGAALTSWPDSSSSGYNATPGSAPTWQSGVVNGKPVVRFASGNYLTSSLPSSPTAATVFAVHKPGDTSAMHAVIGPSTSGTAQGGMELRSTNSGLMDFLDCNKTDIATDVGAISTAAFNDDAVTWASASAVNFYQAGKNTKTQTTSATLTGGTNGTLIGGFFNLSSLVEPYVGDIAEIIRYDRVLTASERSTVDSYIQDKYGITVSDYTASSSAAPRTGFFLV